MSFATKYYVPKFDIEVGEEVFFGVSLDQLVLEVGYGVPIPLRALYLTKQPTATVATAVIDNRMVTLPKAIVESVEEILRCPDSVDDINQGKVGFEIYLCRAVNYHQLGIRWVDI